MGDREAKLGGERTGQFRSYQHQRNPKSHEKVPGRHHGPGAEEYGRAQREGPEDPRIVTNVARRRHQTQVLPVVLVLVRLLLLRQRRRRHLRLLQLQIVQQHHPRRRRHQREWRPGLTPRRPAMEVENSPPPVHQPTRFERVTVAPASHQDHPRLRQHLKSFIQQIALTTLQQGNHRHRHHHHPLQLHRLHPLRLVELVESRPLRRHPDFGPISHEMLCGAIVALISLDFNCTLSFY